MADIQSFYEYMSRQAEEGTVILEGTGEFGIPVLLEKLSLERLTLKSPVLSPLALNEFSLQGSLLENGKGYDCCFTVTAKGGGCDCLLEARLKTEGDIPLTEAYPTAQALIAWNFYSRPVDLFENMWIKEAKILADTRAGEEAADLSLVMFYEETCPVYANYNRFLPKPGEILRFSGKVVNPFVLPRYIVKAPFLKEVALPFFGERKRVRECEFLINSHVTGEGWIQNGDPIYRCRTGVMLLTPFPELSKDGVWLSVDFGDYRNGYTLFVNFEKGIQAADVGGFIAAITGKTWLPDFPEWADIYKIPLTGLVIGMEGQDFGYDGCLTEDREQMTGAGFHFALELPDIPIPFFDKEQGGAKAQLILQWNLLDIGGFCSVIAGFYGRWKGHSLKINVQIPELEFQGIYERKPSQRLQPNGIFPGFFNLEVEYIRLYGNIPESAYELDFELADDNLCEIPIGEHMFQIDTVTGRAAYSPKGLELFISLEFTLLTAVVQLQGIYESEGERQFLTLKGGLAAAFHLSDLVALISGKEVSDGSLDFSVRQLSMVYRTELTGKEKGEDSLGEPFFFEFLMGIAFEWGEGNAVSSCFHLVWEERKYRLWISAGIRLFKCLDFDASCQVSIENGSASFEQFAFDARIRTIEVHAVYDANQNFVFQIVNFNLGELIEGLMSLFAPEHNWYLPWPFTILKQITLKTLEITIDRNKETLRAKYLIHFKILFLTVESIELFYDYGEGDFFINVKTNASVGFGTDSGAEKRAGADDSDIYALNILKDIFPIVRDVGERLFSLEYLGIGQHILMEIPGSFDENAFTEVLERMKKTIHKEGRPKLDMENNWTAALQLKLIDAVDLTLLMCDPAFYGLKVDIGSGSELVEQLSGLSFMILYSKVTETIGMFYARLKFPEAFRVIELGAVQLQLGEIAISIYTNGNFKIDMGFPHNGDFSRSFGLTYLFFTGKGGFYFGLLSGDTSRAVPQVSRGHFETVLELGIGIWAGVGREISAGPLKAGAYVVMTAVFEGVLANYVPEKAGQKDSIYYKVSAYAGITAAIYGSVDFVLIQVAFSVNISFKTNLTLERYQPAELMVCMSVSVEAYIKILFIKISFRFHFTWKDSFQLGSKSTPPWEAAESAGLAEKLHAYEINWYDGAVMEEKKEICAEIIPYFTFDEPELRKENSGRRKIAFLALLHGLTEETCNRLGYKSSRTTPFGVLTKICFFRAVLSVKTGENENGTVTVNRGMVKFLYDYLCRAESFKEGFLFQKLNGFLTNNVVLSYIKSEGTKDMEIQGIPFPLFPRMELTWFSAPDTIAVYDLEREPVIREGFYQELLDYYHQLALWKEQPERLSLSGSNENVGGDSASAFVFSQYFYMLTRTVVSLVLDKMGDGDITLEQAGELASDEELLEKASGMISRFSYGGSRVYRKEEGTKSLYAFAMQEFDGLDPAKFSEGELVHSMSMRLKTGEEVPGAGENALEQERSGYGQSGVRLVNRDFRAENQILFSGNSLQWNFTKEDLTYPGGALQMEEEIEIMPFYRSQAKTLELKNPLGLLGGKNVSFREIQEEISGDYSIALIEEEGEVKEAFFEKGYLLQLPLRKSGNNIFEMESPGYENISRISGILIGGAEKITPYRYTNELDEENCGLAPVDGDVFLYRSNLCMEAEKPVNQEPDFLTAEENYKNSAYSTEPENFLSLLRDAALVNAGGYYLKFHLEDRHILADGKMTLVLWVQTREKSGAVKITDEKMAGEERLAALTGENDMIYAYEPGTFAFSMKAALFGEPEKKGILGEQYQMLGYKILENEYFKESNESLPLFSQEENGESRYSQSIPACRFGSEDGGNPYGGIAEGSRLKMEFRLIDLLGNRSADGKQWEMDYGYTDPLLPISVYPHTKCVYEMEKAEDSYELIITIAYVEDENQKGSREDKNLQTAYWQLQCPDISCLIEVCGREVPVEMEPLRRYVTELYEGKRPEPVSYSLPFEAGEEVIPLEIAFCIRRNPALIAGCLRGTPKEEEILSVRTLISEDREKTDKNYLARRGRNGKLFYVPPVCPVFTDYEIWTLPPLFNKLQNMKDILVTDEKGEEQTVSYYQVDMEEWAEDFLGDMEGFLKPDSLYGEDRNTCEGLLKIKKELAGVIARNAAPVRKDRAVSESENPGYYESAVSYYENLMLQNLYNGYKLNAAALLKAKEAPAAGRAWCFHVKTDGGRVTLKPGKVKQNGILPIGIELEDVSRQMHIDDALQLSVTDWETEGEPFYDYLTIQKQNSILQNITGDIPYKRFPQLPILKDQEYEEAQVRSLPGGGKLNEAEGLYLWNYTVSFVHDTAEQDIVTLRLITESERKLVRSNENFLRAMAEYRYLRDKMLVDAGLKDRLLQTCKAVQSSWPYEISRPLMTSANELQILFSLTFSQKQLLILKSDIPLKQLKIQMMNGEGKFAALEQKEGYFVLPDELPKPCQYIFTVSGFDIRKENCMNACISVTRNQGITGIDERFIFRSDEVRFPDTLLPFLQRQGTLALGEFAHDHFIRQLQEICEGFGRVVLEAGCKAPVVQVGEKIIYSYLPVLYVPEINAVNRTEMLGTVYDKICQWLNENFGTEKMAEKGLALRLHLTLFAEGDGKRTLAELADVEFI